MLRQLRRRLLRAARPLLLKLIDWQFAASNKEIERLHLLQQSTTHAEVLAVAEQVRLSARRKAIERI